MGETKVIDMEDMKLTYTEVGDKVKYTIQDSLDNKEETVECSKEAFDLALKAAADDSSLSEEEYAIAETVMGSIRWIP